MLQLVLAQVHYQPDSWKDHAHTDYVQMEFGQMFQLKYVNRIEKSVRIHFLSNISLGLFFGRIVERFCHTDRFMYSSSS